MNLHFLFWIIAAIFLEFSHFILCLKIIYSSNPKQEKISIKESLEILLGFSICNNQYKPS